MNCGEGGQDFCCSSKPGENSCDELGGDRPCPVWESTTEPPTLQPTPLPTPEPTPTPTPEPTLLPTPGPTPQPTPEPTRKPTPEPTPLPTPEPTPMPTPVPTPLPTPEPTPFPTPKPTMAPIMCSCEFKGSRYVNAFRCDDGYVAHCHAGATCNADEFRKGHWGEACW